VSKLFDSRPPAAVERGRDRRSKDEDYGVVLVERGFETEWPVAVYQARYGEHGHWVDSLVQFTARSSGDGN